LADSPNNAVHLSFTIGPVQTFVAQARRTRDLWAGSWLLSYLAETALAAAERTGGTAVIPHRDQDRRGKVTSTDSPIGGYPNRFELSFDFTDQAKQAANDATDALREVWNRVASAVWEKYVEPAADQGNGTQYIWDRQVETFWEIGWVVGAPNDDAKTITHLAAARKNIRNVNAPPELGVKCSLMGTLQEISGHQGNDARKKQVAFWEKLQQGIGGLDIKQGERLCAIALIKRLFPHVIEEAVIGNVAHELTQQESWPSTAFFAALPWLKKVEQETSARSDAEQYAKLASAAGWNNSERQAARNAGLQAEWTQLDGPAWFADAVRQNEPGADPATVAELLEKLANVRPAFQSDKAAAAGPPGKADVRPVPYYALLVMDGDSMGKLVTTLESPQKVSQGLAKFAEAVKDAVEKENGRTIYAGGDDVLALLPAENALAAAEALRATYAESFAGASGTPVPEATLSGAVVYAHWKFPLRQVLQTAHHLLDAIAKDRTGRDSLAIGVIQGSGLQAVWSAPWGVMQGQENDGFGNLQEFVDQFGSDSNNKETTQFNASFLYLLREQFSKLFAKPIDAPGTFGKLDIGTDLLVDIANSEYRRRMNKEDRKKRLPSETRMKVQPLIALSRPWTRCEETGKVTSDKRSFSFDGWRIARFLKQVQDGKVSDHE